jgi:hypothetical protein
MTVGREKGVLTPDPHIGLVAAVRVGRCCGSDPFVVEIVGNSQLVVRVVRHQLLPL